LVIFVGVHVSLTGPQSFLLEEVEELCMPDQKHLEVEYFKSEKSARIQILYY
jgi:hypothetical protein